MLATCCKQQGKKKFGATKGWKLCHISLACQSMGLKQDKGNLRGGSFSHLNHISAFHCNFEQWDKSFNLTMWNVSFVPDQESKYFIGVGEILVLWCFNGTWDSKIQNYGNYTLVKTLCRDLKMHGKFARKCENYNVLVMFLIKLAIW